MKTPASFALAILCAASLSAAPPPKAPSKDYKALAARLQKRAIVVDTHEDVPERLQKEWVDFGARNTTGHVDIPRLKEGGVTAAFLAAYVPAAYAEEGGSSRKALELIELIHRLAESHPELTFADSVEGIREAKRRGKIAILIGIEGGHAIENSLGALGSFYRLGVRYMTLTHTNTNAWADSSGSFWSSDFDPKKYVKHDGLTSFGREVVLEMNRLGMLVDISHVSDKTLADVLEVSKAPVFASHSSCRALSAIPRNLTDDQIRAIARKGGVVMVNVSSMFVEQRAIDEFKAKRAALAPEIAAVKETYKGDPKKAEAEVSKLLEGVKVTPASWKSVADHIDRIIKVAGREAVGLGTDFDGIPDPPQGLEDVSKVAVLTEELLRRGHSEKVVRGVLGENFLKFWDRAERARSQFAPRSGLFPFTQPGP
ncbi:MAG TPA: membrane dipeptidase [Thermoanaerobaculia bacterium]|nr:membrane dipeptidase [Thermoanaerobaculia bacterium]